MIAILSRTSLQMAKPKPQALSQSMMKIETEKLMVLKRTEERIAQLQSQANSRISDFTYPLAFCLLVLLLYTAFCQNTRYGHVVITALLVSAMVTD